LEEYFALFRKENKAKGKNSQDEEGVMKMDL